MAYTYDYPRPALTVDVAVFREGEAGPEVLLIKRKNPPFKDYWAFPGGFVDEGEDLEPAAHRELKEETGLGNLNLKQYRTYGQPGRDPRGHTVSVVYTGFLNDISQKVRGGDDAAEAAWFLVKNLPQMAFDHRKILNDCIESLF